MKRLRAAIHSPESARAAGALPIRRAILTSAILAVCTLATIAVCTLPL